MGKKNTPKLSYNTKLILSFLFLFPAIDLIAQTKSIKYEVEMQVNGTTNGSVPFWMRSNQFGSIPLSALSSSFIGRANSDYNDQKNQNKISNWGFGFEGRINLGKNSNINIIEAYLKGKLSIFQVKIGRSKDVIGFNGDSTAILTSGNFAVSGNAIGIPKVEISIPKYYTLPAFNGLFSIKGNFSNGWIGKIPVQFSFDTTNTQIDINTAIKAQTYFHQKSLYVRLGKADWKLKLYGGFNHQVFWGDERKVYGDNFKLNTVQTFFYVATGKTYGSENIPKSKIGNQLGSIDLGAEYDFDNIKVTLYRQNFYDTGALSKLANIKDGLNGVVLENKNASSIRSKFRWKKILLEFFYSKDQAGYPWSIPTKSGDEDYYNNYYYLQGWSYKSNGLGSPLLTPKHYAKPGQVTGQNDYFMNNRVSAYHAGIDAALYDWDVKLKLTYSNNYGTFGTSSYGKSTGSKHFPSEGLFEEVNEFSAYIDTGKKLKNDVYIGFVGALDYGKLLNNSIGFSARIRKNF